MFYVLKTDLSDNSRFNYGVFDEKNPAHQLCKITIDQISEAFKED